MEVSNGILSRIFLIQNPIAIQASNLVMNYIHRYCGKYLLAYERYFCNCNITTITGQSTFSFSEGYTTGHLDALRTS